MRLFVKSVVAAAAAVTLAVAPSAAQVTYSTSGVFSGGGCTVSACTIGGVTITFNGLNSSSTGVPSHINFGDFVTSGSGSGTFSSFFTLTINQTVPSSGSGSFSAGTLSGLLTGTASGVDFTAVSGEKVQLGDYVYTWRNTQYGLVSPLTNDGLTTLQGHVEVVPEPGSLLLLGTGLLGLTRIRRRRRNT